MALATHLLRRSLLTASPRATAFTPSSSSTRALLLTPTTKILSSQQQSRLLSISARARAANPQAGGPTSKDAGHAAKNIKEEAAAVGSSIASAIGGRSGMTEKKSGKEESGGSGMSAILEDAKTIGGEMAKAVPQPALIWGAAGIIPYVSTAAASIWLARQAKLVSEGLEKSLDFDTAQALLIHAQNLQLTYGAVILSFLGAIHWGFEFSKYGGTVGNWRYAMGVLPVAVAWPSLLLTPQLGLITQWGAFVAIWFFDLRATQRGWVPGWYSTYRFWLTAFVGGSIILTLAGTQYYDTEPTRSAARGAGARLEQNVKQDEGQKIQLIHKSAEGDKGGPRTEIKGVESEVVSKSGGEDGDSWVKVENPKKQEEERKKKEEEEKKKEEEQKNKDKEQKEEAGKQTDKSE